MSDILNKVVVKASPAETYKALTTPEGLSGWWTTDTQGEDKVGANVHFQFADRGAVDVKVLELDPGKRVLWEVVNGPDAWIGTTIAFDLAPDEDATVVLFTHDGWAAATTGFRHHCTTKWAMFLMSLKSLLETGRGRPFPDDVHITNKGN